MAAQYNTTLLKIMDDLAPENTKTPGGYTHYILGNG